MIILIESNGAIKPNLFSGDLWLFYARRLTLKKPAILLIVAVENIYADNTTLVLCST